MPDSVSSTYGVHSEVGRLRKVLVCRPGLAHRRLTPSNNDELLFDDVMWVENAQRDHADFVNKMTSPRRRGRRAARPAGPDDGDPRGPRLAARPQDRAEPGRPRAGRRHPRLPRVARSRASWRSSSSAGSPPTTCPRTSAPTYVALARESTGAREYLMPPLPNTLYTRDTTCWLYGGLTMNPLYWPARKDETLIYKAIYQFHPDFVGSTVWWGDPEQDWAQATFEGGDIMPVGNGVVLMGMSERTSRQAITQVAAALFAQGAAERVVVAGMPRLRAAMHLDTVFTFADRDIVTLYPTIMDAVHTFTLLPVRQRRSGSTSSTRRQPVRRRGRPSARAAGAAGDRDRRRRLPVRAAAVGQRQQRRRARARRGLHLRPQHPDQHLAAQGRRRGDHDRRRRARPRPRRRPLHDLPAHPRRRSTSDGSARERSRPCCSRRAGRRAAPTTPAGAGDEADAEQHPPTTPSAAPVEAADLEGTTYTSTSVEGHDLVEGTSIELGFDDGSMSVSAGLQHHVRRVRRHRRDAGLVRRAGRHADRPARRSSPTQDQWLTELLHHRGDRDVGGLDPHPDRRRGHDRAHQRRGRGPRRASSAAPGRQSPRSRRYDVPTADAHRPAHAQRRATTGWPGCSPAATAAGPRSRSTATPCPSPTPG